MGEIPTSLRVVQLNIGSLFEPDWARRKHEIAAWLLRLQPDVVCLEEASQTDPTTNTAQEIVDLCAVGSDAPGFDGSPIHWHMRFEGEFPTGTTGDPSTKFGTAVLSRWPIDSWSYVRLPVDQSLPDPFGIGAFPWELVHASTAGLDIFVAHLAAAPVDARHRRTQVRFIDSYVKDMRGPRDHLAATRSPMPPILCGDFNAEPESDEIRYLTGFTSLDGHDTFWQDAWRVAATGGAASGPGLTNDWTRNPIAAGMNVHRKRIDYVFVGDPFYRPGRGGRVLNAAVVFDEPMTGIVASDHFGVCVDITWPNRPA